MRKMMNTPKPTTMVLFFLMLLGTLVFVAACGNSSTTTGATSSSPQTQATSTTSTSTSGSGYGGGRYGNGGGTTPTAVTTPTTPITGATQTVMITTDSSGTFTFSPKSLSIKVGTTVIWKNMTQAPHTVTSNDGKSFNSGMSTPVAPGTTFSFKFTTAGTFAYHCSFHPFMIATIIVQ